LKSISDQPAHSGKIELHLLYEPCSFNSSGMSEEFSYARSHSFQFFDFMLDLYSRLTIYYMRIH